MSFIWEFVLDTNRAIRIFPQAFGLKVVKKDQENRTHNPPIAEMKLQSNCRLDWGPRKQLSGLWRQMALDPPWLSFAFSQYPGIRNCGHGEIRQMEKWLWLKIKLNICRRDCGDDFWNARVGGKKSLPMPKARMFAKQNDVLNFLLLHPLHRTINFHRPRCYTNKICFEDLHRNRVWG